MKHIVTILFAISLLSLPTFGDALGNISKPPKSAISINLSRIARDQPRIKRIFEWDKQIVLEADQSFYRVNLKKQTTTPIFCPGERALVDLSTQPSKRSYALCKGNDGLFMFVRSNKKGWDSLELPKSLRETEDKVFLLSNADNLILLTNKDIYRYSNNNWRQTRYQQNKELNSRSSFTIGKDDHTILFKDKIFVAHDWGEWGGGLVSLDSNTGKWEDHFSGTPVTGLAINSKGELWISQGVSHLGGVRGVIRNYDGKSWKVFSENKGFVDIQNRDLSFKNVSKKNWPFDPADFNSLTFDENNKLLILSGSIGVLTYEEGDWRKLIEMKPHVYVSSFLVINKNTLLVGLYDGGVVVLDVVSGKFKRIRMAESFYYWDQPADKSN